MGTCVVINMLLEAPAPTSGSLSLGPTSLLPVCILGGSVMAQALGSLSTTLDTWTEFQAPGSGLTSPQHSGHLEHELVGKDLFPLPFK